MTAPTSARRPGRFGDYGGRYVPETLVPALDELEAAWRAARTDPTFVAELRRAASRLRRAARRRSARRGA